MMKKSRHIFALFLGIALLLGCTDGLRESLSGIRDRVTDLEAKVKEINSSLNAVQTIVDAVESNNLIVSVTPVGGTADKPQGYLVTFASGTTVTIWNGVDGDLPIMGINRYSDGEYYWTVRTESGEQWLKNNLGMRVKASGITPQLKVENDYWWISYDSGVNWAKLYKAVGSNGTTLFKEIDISNSEFITFRLANGTVFQVATMSGAEKVNAQCEKINNNIASIKELLSSIDTARFVTSISEIVSGDTLLGYSIVLENGKELKLYNCKSDEPGFEMIALMDNNNNIYYWAARMDGEEDYTWLRDGDGKRLMATTISGTPLLSAADTLGSYYFTVSYDGERYEWLRNDKGDMVKASGMGDVVFFRSVTVSADNVEIVFGDGKAVVLPIYTSPVLSIVVSTPASISAGSSVACTFDITPAVPGLVIEAIGLNGAVVSSVSAAGCTVYVPAGATGKATFLVFVSWKDNVIMKSVEIPIV